MCILATVVVASSLWWVIGYSNKDKPLEGTYVSNLSELSHIYYFVWTVSLFDKFHLPHKHVNISWYHWKSGEYIRLFDHSTYGKAHQQDVVPLACALLWAAKHAFKAHLYAQKKLDLERNDNWENTCRCCLMQ